MQIHLLGTIRRSIIIKYLKTVGLLICAVLNMSCDIVNVAMDAIQDRKLSETEIRTIIENCSCVEEIQTEVDSLFSHYGDNKHNFLHDVDQKEIQALTNLANALGGKFIGIEERNEFTNEPGYVYIRFNGHRNVQFLMISKSGEDLSVLKLRHKHLFGNIYLR